MRVENYLNEIIRKQGAAHLTLIDPAKQEPEIAAMIAKDAADGGTNGIMVGGSTLATGELLEKTVIEIKKMVNLPVILFPANEQGICRHADAIFFMSLLNSRNPYFISGAQRLGAPIVKRYGIEPIPMAYIIIEPGGKAGEIGEANAIPRNRPDLAADYALAGEYLGMRFIYLEAGSGADKPVPVEIVRKVRKAITVKLIVGGGIRTPGAAAERVKAGADIIVTGTLVERSANRVAKIKEIVKMVKTRRAV
ncbi:MAG: geranylgeranylglyceryl/heptaprenylglyceryl phosphate synthase [Hadesarchaea archaeon YNP_N21]|jgi:phosphoglycerol geranylgeranyltransferase|nr:MAG: geranylgeranylglyceryl/heptaprenylglyceryl phosphate synthase [Hadesarchaea archaeon YNP_N21]